MDFLSKIQDFFSIPKNETKKKQEPIIIHSDFQLPIDYLENKDVKNIAEHVSNDLELMNNPNENEKNMYQHLFQPTNPFGEEILHKWNEKYTTNTDFLQQSQTIIQNMKNYKENMTNEELNVDGLLTLWKNTKKNTH